MITLIRMLEKTLELTFFSAIVIWMVYCLAIVGFSFAGSILADEFKRSHILYFWIIIGVFISLFFIFVKNVTLGSTIIYSLFLGGSFGLGMPSCLALFADAFPLEQRGSLSGIIFLMTNLIASLIIISINSLSLMSVSIILAAWRATGLITIIGSKFKIDKDIPNVKLSFNYVFQDRSFFLYFLPWTLFCFINRLSTPIVEPLLENNLRDVPQIIEPLIGSFFALIGGILAGRIGRKRIVIYGFISLGVAFALIGIAPGIKIANIFFVLINAISAGLLWVMFILTIWGDLSLKRGSEKYYAMGNMPFFVTWGIFQLLSAQYLIQIPVYTIFSFASFFLFLAVLPLMYAPETLPEKKIKDREYRNYLEKAKKIKERYE
jgi:MFS family permease